MRNCCVLKCQVRLTKDKETKENKGFAFVTFTDKDSAQRAVEDVQDKDYKVVWILKRLPTMREISHVMIC
jgi:RNA recognition motif-containing protein